MKDKLKAIFQMQKYLNDEIKAKRNIKKFTKEEWMQKQTLAMLSELSELIDEVNFKWWKNPKKIDETKIKGELVDILHFFVSMCLIYDMNSEELYDMYMEKNKENFDRQKGKSQKAGYNIDEN